MKYLPHIAGVLLGLLFIMAASVVLFHLAPMPDPKTLPPDVAKFNEVFMSTGYMTFVKIFELLGGILVIIPRTRNLGLLILGPILVNILAFTVFVAKGEGLSNPMLIVIVLLALYLLWSERKAFGGLINR